MKMPMKMMIFAALGVLIAEVALNKTPVGDLVK